MSVRAGTPPVFGRPVPLFGVERMADVAGMGFHLLRER
jgi:hypothetical protein